MLKKIYAVIPVILFLTIAVFSQETEEAASSSITDSKLPTGAVRILPNSVPAEINDGLKKLVEAGEGKLVEGDSEVIAWADANYKKKNSANLISQLQRNLQANGWTFEVSGTEDGITVFSVLRTAPSRRALLGFYAPTDDALVLAWTEVSSPDSQTQTEKSTQKNVPKLGNVSGGIVGTWTNGTVSMMSEKNLSTGAISSRGGSTFDMFLMRTAVSSLPD